MAQIAKDDADRPVSLKSLAEELGFHSSAVRKAIVRRGFSPFRLSQGPNKPLYLTRKDAELFKKQVSDERSNTITPATETIPKNTSGVYFLEVPSYDGMRRFKLGWSDKLADRLATYRTIVPDLRVIAIWKTVDVWCERAALKCAERLGRRIHQELFEFDDSRAALCELNDLFLKLGIDSKKDHGENST